MPLADDFQPMVDALPPDWTHLEADLRIDDEDRYIEAATLLSQVNAMPSRSTTGTSAYASRTSSAMRPPPRRSAARWRCSTTRASPACWSSARRARAAWRSSQMWGRPGVGAPGVRAPRAVAAVARVALLCPDLLFGSKLRGGLQAAGHEVVGADARRTCRCST